jgi:dihydroorotate dehydrogenase (NAD+) catalytic subunit
MSAASFESLHFLSPVVAAAGTFALSWPAGRLSAGDGIGAIVTPGYGPRSRAGRPTTLQETPAGVLYSPSTAWVGIREGVRRQARLWQTSSVPVIVNLLGDTPEDFAAAAAYLEGVRGPIAIEINLAHASGGGERPLGDDPQLTSRSITSVRQVCQLPVIVKLPFDPPDLEAVLRACAAARAVAVTLSGGVPVGDAYLIGPATFPLVLERVRRIAPLSLPPVIACGGAASARQARAYLDAGAVAVQIGSAHLANPRAATDIAAQLTAPAVSH